MSFKDYIAARRITDTCAGDFTYDAKRDRTLPDARSWDELHSYLIFSKGACHEAIVAARTVWRQYRRGPGKTA